MSDHEERAALASAFLEDEERLSAKIRRVDES